MEENEKKHFEAEASCRVNEPMEGVVACSPSTVLETEPCYDFDGRDLGLPVTLDEVKAELVEADRELDKPEMWTSLSGFLSDFKHSHSSWLK